MNPSGDPVEIGTSKNCCGTKIKIEKLNFLWTVENFSYCLEETGKSLYSYPIKYEKNFKSEWALEIYPKGVNKRTDGFMAIYLCLNECNIPEVTAKYKFYILNERGEKKYSLGQNEFQILSSRGSWGLRKFITRDFLFDESNKLLINDKLTILCEIYIICGNVNTKEYSSTASVDKPLPKITEDIGNMLNMSTLSDCAIKVDGINIPVHKFMLASRSEVFYAMFDNECGNSISNIIEITDFNLAVVKEMLNFMYTNKSPNLKEMPKEILAISEKYNLRGLKTMAEDALSNSLDVKNVCEYFEISEIHFAESLRKKCVEFICMNILNLLDTNDWYKMITMYPLLPEEIFKKLAGVNIKSTVNDFKKKIESESESDSDSEPKCKHKLKVLNYY